VLDDKLGVSIGDIDCAEFLEIENINKPASDFLAGGAKHQAEEFELINQSTFEKTLPKDQEDFEIIKNT